MNIGILGTGIVGITIGSTLTEAGHKVLYGTRDVAATQARKEPDAFGNPSFGDWQRDNPDVDLGDITTARGTEMMFALWARLFAKTGNPIMNFRVVS